MSRRVDHTLSFESYGESVLGTSLQWIPSKEKCKLLIVAGIHGEEPDTTVSLSRAYRSLRADELDSHVASILCANPDGVQLGTRGNANGVDLNRNFPTQTWQNTPATCRWHADEPERLPILTGSAPGSEPETTALVRLIEHLAPSSILSLHGPLACVDDPLATPLGNWIAGKTGLPLVPDVGYPTPGSLGTWAAERNIPIVTWEFPPERIEILSRSQVPVLIEILKGNSPV